MKVGSEVTHYRPPTSNSAHLVVSTCTRPYLVWVNLLNEDVLRFEVSVVDSLAVQEANPLVCGEKSTTLASLVEARYTSEMSVHTFQNSQLLRCGPPPLWRCGSSGQSQTKNVDGPSQTPSCRTLLFKAHQLSMIT